MSSFAAGSPSILTLSLNPKPNLKWPAHPPSFWLWIRRYDEVSDSKTADNAGYKHNDIRAGTASSGSAIGRMEGKPGTVWFFAGSSRLILQSSYWFRRTRFCSKRFVADGQIKWLSERRLWPWSIPFGLSGIMWFNVIAGMGFDPFRLLSFYAVIGEIAWYIVKIRCKAPDTSPRQTHRPQSHLLRAKDGTSAVIRSQYFS